MKVLPIHHIIVSLLDEAMAKLRSFCAEADLGRLGDVIVAHDCGACDEAFDRAEQVLQQLSLGKAASLDSIDCVFTLSVVTAAVLSFVDGQEWPGDDLLKARIAKRYELLQPHIGLYQELQGLMPIGVVKPVSPHSAGSAESWKPWTAHNVVHPDANGDCRASGR